MPFLEIDREGGYIKLWRRIESWPLWRSMTANQRMVWVQLLWMANWKRDEFWYGTHRIVVERGQLAHAEAEIAQRARVGRQVVRDTILKLQTEGAITRNPTIPGTKCPHIITITNYSQYQDVPEEKNPTKNRSRTNREPIENQSRTLREEGKEYKEGEEASDLATLDRPARKDPDSPQGRCFAHWRDTVWPRVSDHPYKQTKADFIQLASALKTLSEADLRTVMDRSVDDQFWRGKQLAVIVGAAATNQLLAKKQQPKRVTARAQQPHEFGKDGKSATIDLSNFKLGG